MLKEDGYARKRDVHAAGRRHLRPTLLQVSKSIPTTRLFLRLELRCHRRDVCAPKKPPSNANDARSKLPAAEGMATEKFIRLRPLKPQPRGVLGASCIRCQIEKATNEMWWLAGCAAHGGLGRPKVPKRTAGECGTHNPAAVSSYLKLKTGSSSTIFVLFVPVTESSTRRLHGSHPLHHTTTTPVCD